MNLSTFFIVVFSIIFFFAAAATICSAEEAWPSDSCENGYMYSGAQTSPSSYWTTGEINAILKAHNDVRRNVVPPASKYQTTNVFGQTELGMRMLVWDQKLADHARAYIITCPGLVHSSSTYRSNVVGDNETYSSVGENLAAGSSMTAYGNASIGVSGTKAWAAELTTKSWTYDCNPFGSGSSCNGAGHYTQIVSSRSFAIGCASAYCPSDPYKNYLICLYGRAGNLNTGSSPVYNKTDRRDEASPCQNMTSFDKMNGAFSLSKNVIFVFIFSIFVTLMF